MTSAAHQPPAPSATAQPADDGLPPSQNTSSFAIPPAMYSLLAEVLAISKIAPAPLAARLSKAVPPSWHIYFTRPAGATIWSALFADGYACAATSFLLAILVNHVRRMLVPWLGAWVHYTPLADLKMALGSPHYLLEEQLGSSVRGAAGMVLQKGVVDLLGGAAARLVVRGAPRGRSLGVEVARVGVLIWALAAAEYMQARTFNAVAVVIAVRRLVTGSKVHMEVLGEVLARHWVVVPVYAWWVVYYLGFGVGPLVWTAGLSAIRGRPGLLGVIGATGYVTYFVTRWSNKYYIVLELWGFVLVVAWVAVGLLTLAGRVAMEILRREDVEKTLDHGREGLTRETPRANVKQVEGHVVGEAHSNRTRRRA